VRVLFASLSSAFFLIACQPEDQHRVSEADLDRPIAYYNGGTINFQQASLRLSQDRRSGNVHPQCRDDGVDSMSECFRAICSDIALERILSEGIEAGNLSEAEQRRFEDLLMREYLTQATEPVVIEDADIADYYQDNKDQFVTAESIQLWNIFKRAGAESEMLEAVGSLEDARRRFERGETFSSLAREYSDSETRLRNGRVGSVRRGELAPNLEKAAFALNTGEISEPIEVPGGAVLLHVSARSPRVEPPLEAVSQRIRTILTQARQQSLIAELAADLLLSQEVTVLSEPEFKTQMNDGDRAGAILGLGAATWTANELFGDVELPDDADQKSSVLDQLWIQYRHIADLAIIRHWLRTSQEPQPTELRARVEPHLRAALAAQRADTWLAGEIKQTARIQNETLRTYFQANRMKYTTPFSVKLDVLKVPATQSAPTRMRQLEELAASEADFPSWRREALRFDGTVTQLDRIEFSQLENHLPVKAFSMISQAAEGNAVGPFIDDDELYLIRIRERQEPRQTSFEDAFDAVLTDYTNRFAESLATQSARGLLKKHRFRFDDRLLRDLLLPPSIPAES